MTIEQLELPGMTTERLDGTRRHGARRQPSKWGWLPQLPYCDSYEMVANLGPAPTEGLPGQTAPIWITGGPAGKHTACRAAVDDTGTAWPLGCGVPLAQGRFESDPGGHPLRGRRTVAVCCGASAAEHYARVVVGTLIGLAVAKGWGVYACPERETVTVRAQDLRTGRVTQVGVLVEGSIFGPPGEIRFERGDWPAVDRTHPWTEQPILREPLR